MPERPDGDEPQAVPSEEPAPSIAPIPPIATPEGQPIPLAIPIPNDE